MKIRDRGVRQFTETLQAQPQPKLDDSNVLQLLAEVGDRFLRGAGSTLKKLTREGITRQEQFELAKKGLSDDEKADLAAVLDESGFEMSPGARNFLEALTGRAPLHTAFGPLTVTGDQRNGIQGIARPGEIVEAINLSVAPGERRHLVETTVLGTADAFGKFSGQLPELKEGDIIGLRTRAADGSTSDWLTITARGLEPVDTRPAIVNLERIDLEAAAEGMVAVTHNTERPLSEPGATVRFVNKRTREATDVTITENGSLPPGFALRGQAGDTFFVAVSDGRTNADFKHFEGRLRVLGPEDAAPESGLADPAPLAKDTRESGKPKFRLVRFKGPLFVDGVSPGDVRQGAISNCYFPAAVAAIAHMRPERIQEAIRDNGDGTCTVKFHDWPPGQGQPVEVVVDADLYARSFGGPAYGCAKGTPARPEAMELWFALLEKAYAQWKGGYETIGNGGHAGRVMEELLGAPCFEDSIRELNKLEIWEQIKEGEQKKQPMAAGTYGHREAARYTNSGVYADHAYSVLGVEEEGGVKYVKLRNPWGQSEPTGDGKDDGCFRLDLDTFARLFRGFSKVLV